MTRGGSALIHTTCGSARTQRSAFYLAIKFHWLDDSTCMYAIKRYKLMRMFLVETYPQWSQHYNKQCLLSISKMKQPFPIKSLIQNEACVFLNSTYWEFPKWSKSFSCIEASQQVPIKQATYWSMVIVSTKASMQDKSFHHLNDDKGDIGVRLEKDNNEGVNAVAADGGTWADRKGEG